MQEATLFDLPKAVSQEEAWDRQNPEIWEAFKAKALAMIRTGRTRYSAWAVMSAVRWDTDIKTTGDIFKVNNNLIAYYTRKFIRDFPQYKNFFETRRSKFDGRGN